MTTKQIEAYIEARSANIANKGDKYAQQYGSALVLLQFCLDEMTPEQIKRALGPFDRETQRMGVIE